MKKHILPILLLTPTLSHAFEFIPPDIGDHCAERITVEKTLGATLTEEHDESYKFELSFREHNAKIQLNCHHGKLSRGTYNFWFTNLTTAEQFFRQQQAELIIRYGVPTIDQSSEAYIEHMQSIGFEIKEEHQLMLVWKTPMSEIVFGVNRKEDGSAVVTLDIIPGPASELSQHH